MTIFVTVGAQMPFDRLVDAVDGWAAEHGRTDVFAQVAATDHPPKWISHRPFLDAKEFLKQVQAADLIVGHAGMGTILTGLEHGRPLLVLPRQAALHETRNDHQIATARTFGDRGVVCSVFSVAELVERLDAGVEPATVGRISPYAPPEFLNALREFVDGGSV